MICTTNDQHGIRVLARWHRSTTPAGELAPNRRGGDIARCNLRALGRGGDTGGGLARGAG